MDEGTLVALQQPNFPLIGERFHSAVDEILKIQNVPAIAGSELILAQLREIKEEIAAIRRDIAATRQDIAAVRQEMATRDQNNTARVQNSYISRRTDRLSPFLNPSNGAIIFGFPVTPQEIRNKNEQQIDAILQQLGILIVPGATLPEKKKELWAHIGLRAEIETLP